MTMMKALALMVNYTLPTASCLLLFFTDSYREELTHSSLTHSSQPVNVAHSLPISVPMFRTYSSQQQMEYRDEKV